MVLEYAVRSSIPVRTNPLPTLATDVDSSESATHIPPSTLTFNPPSTPDTFLMLRKEEDACEADSGYFDEFESTSADFNFF